MLLGELLTTYTIVQYGIGPEQIAEAFDEQGDRRDRSLVISSVRFLGDHLLSGLFTTFARPIGGGEPMRLEPSMWELDDFLPRFATCALDLRRPFDHSSPPTHRIFTTEEDRQALFDACCQDSPIYSGPRIVRQAQQPVALADEQPVGPMPLDRLIRINELEGLVGMSRSTIYDRIGAGRFPEPVKNGSRLSGWYESAIRAWLADPR